ncbi:MAG: outer membrane protein transport protein [Oligoflexia bacterium]|nr:outer membrane protein transport protein [Oligoflexia bacterium]
MLGKNIQILFILFFVSNNASARELYGPDAGVVPFGMGRAYSAIADDWLALHYNPAGLALVRKVDFQVFDIKVSSNQDVIGDYKNISDLDSSGSTASTLDKYAGKHVAAQISNHTQITVPYVALGFSYDVRAEIDTQNKSLPVTNMRFTRDFKVSVGGAASIGKQKDLRFGARFDWIKRKGGYRKLRIDEISGSTSALVDFFNNYGDGIAGTFGMQYKLPLQGRTEVITSFVWHDIGKTSYGSHTMANRPTRTDDNITVGAAIRLPIGGRKNRRLERRYGPTRSTNHLTFAFDYSHLNYSLDEEHFPKHIHLGMNLDLPILSIQLGLNQTSFTMGTSFDIGIIRVAVATYAEELGSYAGQRRDRRYLLSIGSGLGFKGF